MSSTPTVRDISARCPTLGLPFGQSLPILSPCPLLSWW